MKFLSAVVFFLICLFSSQASFGQDSAVHASPDPASLMQDTTIYLEGNFVVMNRYAVKDSIAAYRAWASKMRDTTVMLEPEFVVRNVYAEKDSIEAYVDPVVAKRKAIRDSLNAIGSALMRTADMQDTTIALDPSFVVVEVYALKDSLQTIRDSARSLLTQAATMQDTTIALEPAFVVMDVYQLKDRQDANRDSLAGELERAAAMQDTTIILEPAFVVRNIYEEKDRQDAIQDSVNKPMTMQDTVIVLDPAFVIRDLYPYKDSIEAIRDSVTALRDSLYSDSVSRHWAGWKKYEVKPQNAFAIQSGIALKGKTKTDLQYNVADFYLYLNGDPVIPPKASANFFAAAFLGFKYDDTLLLNSGLGAKVGVGVGIKVYQGKFSSSLHANMHNTEIYKLSDEDSVYLQSVNIEPTTQTLTFKYFPDGSRNEILLGEYQAEYKKFYQKNEDGQDELRRYKVRIIFRCRVSGGFNSIGSGK
jgi:uncharacterized protein (UPF0212 family)